MITTTVGELREAMKNLADDAELIIIDGRECDPLNNERTVETMGTTDTTLIIELF